MGAGVVLQYLLDAPARVASVALVAPVVAVRLRRHHRHGRASGSTPTAPAPAAARPTPTSSRRSRPATPRPTARPARGRSCAPSTSRRARCRWTRAGGRLRRLDELAPAPASTTTRATPPPWRRGRAWRPGARGVLNTMAPTVFDVSGIVDLPDKPPVLWVRGDADQIVSDTSVFDLAFLGSVGAVPGWPGAEVFPPQPMVTQTRSVLDRYAATGGRLPRGRAARRRPLTARRAAAGVRRRAARAPRRPRSPAANLRPSARRGPPQCTQRLSSPGTAPEAVSACSVRR